MKPFEFFHLTLSPFLGVLSMQVRGQLRRLVAGKPRTLILDAGGRRSPYTIGVPADIIVVDLPRATELQYSKDLGLDQANLRKIRSRRSNVRAIIYADMTTAPLRSASFDGVVAVEVLEHVEADAAFVREVWRVLKPGGFFFATTPNGDSNPLIVERDLDEKRHYTKQELESLLLSIFESVSVWYAIRRSSFSNMGSASLSFAAPLRTVMSMLGSVVNWYESRASGLEFQAHATTRLYAFAKKYRKSIP